MVLSLMPHAYNKKAFAAGRSSGQSLLALYCSLVVLEIALKDHSYPPWQGGHRVVDMVSAAGEAALSVQLSGRLSALLCTAVDGTPAPVDANKYPDLRYLRHMTDFAGGSTDLQVQDALAIVSDVEQALRAKGVAHP